MATTDKHVLDKRFKQFVLKIIVLLRILQKTEENKIFGRQLIRSSSSIGANYAEAVFAQTRQEFIHCLKISRKEANETLYWLELLLETNPAEKTKIKTLIDEGGQILKILISSIKTLNSKQK